MPRLTGDCAFCGKPLELDRVGFRDECPHCEEALHACVQCGHYAPGKHNDCNETQADFIKDRDRNNLCDWFRFGPGGQIGQSGLDKSAADQMLKELFNKS